ncbi:CDP-alcohol phosphatidyltransferase [Friedmanniella luteola]|uniref:CDP-alcohol phosphatidyltransferase n=1 Tax=Friedmanniella luteola TaxID=546871 RepID=A0A1H1SK65_9ACTN|nr:CDP-alcohol phosphatidyltransferase family protein [Friedmanniella luteola]SDS48233.1 CDP-alcohol phosphatidyltransferase [Friedmanniella luteola]
MRVLRRGPLLGLAGQEALLVGLDRTVGLGAAGWVVGLVVGLVTVLALTTGLERTATPRLGPADRVTLVRVVLTGGVAALAADALVGPPAPGALVGLAVLGLVLDGVDGRVARRTGTASAFGARFDVEADALLVLVLSLHVARDLGAWVLLIGAARYLFVLAGWLLPWLGAALPPRPWRKVVGVGQAAALLLAASGLVPPLAAGAVVALALLLLAESFGRDALWLHRHRPALVSKALLS